MDTVDQQALMLIVHIVGAFMIVAGVGAETALGVLSGRTRSARMIAAMTQAQVAIERFLIIPGALIVIVFGTWLVARFDLYDFGDFWLVAAYVLWFLAMGIGGGILTRHAKRVNARAQALIAQGVEESEELRQEADTAQAKLFGMLLNVFLVAYVYLMVWKPGS